jgi:hypothetical protein
VPFGSNLQAVARFIESVAAGASEDLAIAATANRVWRWSMMRQLLVTLLSTSLFAVACSPSAPPASDKTSGQAQPARAEPAQAQPNAQAAPSPASGATPSPATPEQPAPSPSQASAAEAAPQVRNVTIPAGISLAITLTTPVASNTSKVEDSVHGTLAKPILVAGKIVVPQGAEISGSVKEAKESGRVKGRASVTIQFDRLVAHDETHQIVTSPVRREAAADTRGDVKKGAVGAGAGAVVGGIAGGGAGAAIGAAVGGAGTVMATKGKEVSLPEGTKVTTTLQHSFTVVVPMSAKGR